MRGFTSILIAFTVFFMISCGGGVKKDADNRVKVIATTTMLGDAVNQIAGDKVALEVLMGPGIDPHAYKAKQSDIAKLRNADIIFYNGVKLEGKLIEVLESLGEQKPVISVERGIDPSYLLNSSEYADAKDPHIWFNTDIWQEVVGYIATELAKLDTENSATYFQNSQSYRADLHQLNEQLQATFGSIDSTKRVLITSHDAFQYFGEAYNIQVMGLQGVSTNAEVGLKRISEMVDFIVTHEIPCVFVESAVSDKSLKAVIEGCAAKGHTVVNGGTLYADALGGKESGADTYINMMLHNTNTIAEALTGATQSQTLPE